MMKIHSLCPCVTFFKAGKVTSGVIALLMQLSVLFWPAAAAWAREYQQQTAIASLLADYASKYPVPMSVLVDRYRFRKGPRFTHQRGFLPILDRAALATN